MIGPHSSLSDLASALRAKKISSVELTQFFLDRLQTVGKEYRSVAEILETTALAEAKKADSTLSKAKSKLHGIPFGVKDLLATDVGFTRWGSPGHYDQKFDFDATVVRKLKETGGVLIAKTAMIELAGGGNYDVPWASDVGATLCAWDKNRWAGGSSSGSGSATAAGCLPLSIGSETSGSITCPSAFNGLTGFRPTYGRVSRHGAMALCWTLDKIGPMCRSAEDCGFVLEAISGYDPQDLTTLGERLNLRRKNGKFKIGLLKEDFNANNEDGRKAYEAAVQTFKSLGWEIVEVSYPVMPYALAVGTIVNAEGASAFEHFIKGERLTMLIDVNQVAGFAASLETKAVDYLWAMRLRTEALKANVVWESCDAIFTPVFYGPAPAADKPFAETWRDMGGDGGPANLLGWPAIAFPIGFSKGAPLGGQFIAPAMREDVCYQLAVAFQKETDFHKQRSPASLSGKQAI